MLISWLVMCASSGAWLENVEYLIGKEWWVRRPSWLLRQEVKWIAKAVCILNTECLYLLLARAIRIEGAPNANNHTIFHHLPMHYSIATLSRAILASRFLATNTLLFFLDADSNKRNSECLLSKAAVKMIIDS